MELDTLTATLFLTDRCNLACSYCYEPDKQYTTLSKDAIIKFINLLFDTPKYSTRKEITLDFIGGEPLLEPELIDFAITTFITEAEKRNHHWSQCRNRSFALTTNGTLFSPEVKSLLTKYPRLGVGLSLDGCKETHDKNRKYLSGKGSYEDILRDFDWWKSTFNQQSVKGTLSRNNLHNVKDMLVHQIDLGLLKPWANPVFEEPWTAEDAHIYEQQLRETIDHIVDKGLEYSIDVSGFTRHRAKEAHAGNWCGTGRYMVTLGLDGNLYPCHRFATNTHKYAIGDINDGVDETTLDKFLTAITGTRCEKCTQNGFCPTCAASFYDINGGKFLPVTNVCEMVKAEQRALDYYKKRVEGSATDVY